MTSWAAFLQSHWQQAGWGSGEFSPGVEGPGGPGIFCLFTVYTGGRCLERRVMLGRLWRPQYTPLMAQAVRMTLAVSNQAARWP